MDDKARIEQWFTTYGSDIHHFLVYYTGRSQAEDLVQEVFVKALKGSRKFQERANPKTWLISIARRVAIDEYRNRRRSRLLPLRLLGERKASEATPEDLAIHRQDVADMYRTVMKLKRTYRDVLLLRIMQQLSAAETAEVLGWTTAQVDVTLHRAIRKARSIHGALEGGVEHAEKIERR
ncbi:sigma-70 family RNA polymerase sigma factor [Cohnella sp. LGH]|uniref:RNA polymerase sigma factor n=1 Tax=Cohnella sp. LGH TaxID=1619153 RepID=UPI001ADAEF25|nr:sigma-70 family RNA polymerase sigma factor [Cohnella sp. LGH]QTH45606.1 sigma-70 family RNA polymerase sigma factor [Cohnella sp. LGH]